MGTISQKYKFVPLSIIILLILLGSLPYCLSDKLDGAPWGQPSMNSPYVRSTIDTRLTFTYYFYWYDWATGAHFYDENCPDHNRYHQVDQESVSWNSVDWHYREFQDMILAGIDVFLPVFWAGNPGSGLNDSWSKQGLGPMQEAINRLQAENANSENSLGVTNPIPKIGMFFDTTAMCLEYGIPTEEGLECYGDLANETHCHTFYLMIKDFFSYFEEEDLQQIASENTDDPTAYIVWMYGAGWMEKVAQSCLDYCKTEFQKDFNHTLLFVGTPEWDSDCPDIEGLYKWGSAVDGMTIIPESPIRIASLSPGFDNGNESIGAVCQVGQSPILTPRSPEYYQSNWTAAIDSNPNWIVIETWNEMHEGTPICRTVEFNGTYIDISGANSKIFHELTLPSGTFDIMTWFPDLWAPIGIGIIFLISIILSKSKNQEK